MSVIKRGFSALGKLAIIVAIAVAFLAGLLGTVYYSLRSPEVNVPNIVGKDVLEGEKALDHDGLNMRRRATRYSPTAKPNTILDQSPRAGEIIKVGQTVAVVISRSSKKEGEEGVASSPEDETSTDESNANAEPAASSSANENSNKEKPNRNSKNRNSNNSNNANNANSNRNANNTNNRNANNRNANDRNANNRNSNANRGNANANSNSGARNANSGRSNSNANSNRRAPAVRTPSTGPNRNRRAP